MEMEEAEPFMTKKLWPWIQSNVLTPTVGLLAFLSVLGWNIFGDIKENTTKLAELTTKVGVSDEASTGTKEKVSENKASVSDLTKALTTSNESLAETNTNLAILVTKFEGSLDRMETNSKDIAQQNTEIKKQNDAIQATVLQVKSTAESLATLVESTDTRFKQINVGYDSLKMEVAKSTNTAKEIELRIRQDISNIDTTSKLNDTAVAYLDLRPVVKPAIVDEVEIHRYTIAEILPTQFKDGYNVTSVKSVRSNRIAAGYLAAEIVDSTLVVSVSPAGEKVTFFRLEVGLAK